MTDLDLVLINLIEDICIYSGGWCEIINWKDLIFYLLRLSLTIISFVTHFGSIPNLQFIMENPPPWHGENLTFWVFSII